MINNNWEEEFEYVYNETYSMYSPHQRVKTFIQSLLDTKDKETQEKLEEQKQNIIKILKEKLTYKNGPIVLTDLINTINNK